MKGFAAWFKTFALGLGGLGLFAVAFVDSSFLSLPEINDILIVVLVTRHPARLVYYAAMQALGSAAGSFVLYWLAQKGGEAFLRKRFSADRVERSARLIRRFGAATLLVTSMLPPPTPFKLFVLLSGALGMGKVRFALSVAAGRFLRYVGEGLLAVWYGEAALGYIRENGKWVGLCVLGICLLASVWWLVRRRRRVGEAGQTAA